MTEATLQSTGVHEIVETITRDVPENVDDLESGDHLADEVVLEVDLQVEVAAEVAVKVDLATNLVVSLEDINVTMTEIVVQTTTTEHVELQLKGLEMTRKSQSTSLERKMINFRWTTPLS